MNSYKLIAGALIRHGLTALFAILVARGWLDTDTAGKLPIPEIATGIVGILATLGWSLWQKAVAKWKFLAALSADPETPPEEIRPTTVPGTIAALAKP